MLKKSRAKIEAIATDMSPAYILAVHENCPEATLVFDHFHIVKLMDEQHGVFDDFSQIRRALFNETKNALEPKVLKGIGPLIKMGETVAKYSFGILNWYDHPISSGPLEGTNNKIKTLKRQAYGYRDIEFFKLKIMAIHEAKYALTG